MSVIETIKRDWMTARIARDRVTATLLGTLFGAIETKTKTFNPARPLTDAEVIAEVKKMLDAVNETGQHVATADGREAQRAQIAIEQTVLQRYMPQQMSEAAIEEFVSAKKAEGLTLGAIMSVLKAERPGMYDGKLASVIVKRVLAA